VRYLVTAKIKPGRAAALADAIDEGTLGQGSVAGGEYVRHPSHGGAKAFGRGLRLLAADACHRTERRRKRRSVR